MKTLNEIKYLAPMNGYKAANAMRGLEPGDDGYNNDRLAAEAYKMMREAGWKFIGYSDSDTEEWSPPIIVTHQNPDFDAIGAAWLLMRHGGMENAIVRFVNTGRPNGDLLEIASKVVDTGRQYDGQKWFDHHQLPGSASNDTCATLQVFFNSVNTNELEYLHVLVNLIFAGDTGRFEADFSRNLGIHALLSSFKAQVPCPTDDQVLEFGFQLLDLLDSRLKHQAAAEAGTRVVVFEGEPIERNGKIVSYPREMELSNMRLLLSEQKERVEQAIAQFEESGELAIYEPCDCGSRVRHNNGGNYHEEIYLCRDSGQVFVKYETTCELGARAEWEFCEDWKKVIVDHADWL